MCTAITAMSYAVVDLGTLLLVEIRKKEIRINRKHFLTLHFHSENSRNETKTKNKRNTFLVLDTTFPL